MKYTKGNLSEEEQNNIQDSTKNGMYVIKTEVQIEAFTYSAVTESALLRASLFTFLVKTTSP